MGSLSRRMSQAPSSNVNLHCSQCHTQIGIFDNEWSRLSTSYARSVRPGTHFNTEVATNKEQTIPEGTSQPYLGGCSLAEVFCTKCSQVVGQYCKAISGPAQKGILKQHLYKFSRTYLKNSDTHEKVDPIFGYGGDIMRSTTRTSATPHLTVPAVPRWSQTPVHREETPARLQPMADSYRRVSAPMSLQNSHETTSLGRQEYGEREESVAPIQLVVQNARLNQQEEWWNSLDARMQENENQLRVMSSVLDAFRGTLDDINTSVKEIKSQNSTPRVENPTRMDFMANLHSMINAMKTAQSIAQENEELRAENEAIKARWDFVQSAMATASGTPASATSAPTSHKNSLGKRKRDGDITGATIGGPSNPALQPRSFSLGNAQVPTPQSSTYSQSQETSNDSRSPSPEEAYAEPDQQHASQSNKEPEAPETRTPSVPLSQQVGKKQRLSDLSQPTKNVSPGVRFALGDGPEKGQRASSDLSIDEDGRRHSAPRLAEESSFMPAQDESASNPAESPTESLEEELQHAPNEDSLVPEVDGPFLGNDEGLSMDVDTAELPMDVDTAELPMDVDTAELPVDIAPAELPMDVDTAGTMGDDLPIGDTVEFSDDEEARPPSSEGPPVRQSAGHLQPELSSVLSPEAHGNRTTDIEKDDPVQVLDPSTPDKALTQSAPSKRTRSKTKAASTASSRRKTTGSDFVKDVRSAAPEPRSLRRIQPLRMNHDKSGQFEHATPETVEAELLELEKPKGPKQYKPAVQTTTKLYHLELKELGLEEWIGKDKNLPEYKQVVAEARERKREQKKHAAFASHGITVPGANMDELSLPSTPSLPEASQQAQALADRLNEQMVATRMIPAKTAAAAKRAAGDGSVGRRRKSKAQREELRRKGDELAKAAMGSSD